MAINRHFSGLIWFFMAILLLLSSAKTDAKEDSPLSNVNLAPFWQFLSAYECMKNHSASCLYKDELNITGMVSVTQDEISDYCKKDGCWDHIKIVLNCIHLVKRNFKFANGATVAVLHDVIKGHCANSTGFTTGTYKSSATKMYKGLPMSLVATLSAALFLIIFNI